MKTFEDKIKILEKVSYDGVDFEVIAIDNLEGAKDPTMAMNLYFAQQAGLAIKQIRINLHNSAVKTEAGALYYYLGNITSESKMGGLGGIVKKAFVGSVTSESAIKPTYKGSGTIMLEPSYKHYILMKLENESIIVDKGLFYCCSNTIEIGASSQKNVSSALLGGEGIFQLKLSGSGVVVLSSDVPPSEIVAYHISEGELLKLDGNFAIARTAGIEFSVTKSDKSLLGSALNGEGFLNTFTGQGTVWIAPTAPIYRKMELGMTISNAGSNNIQ